MLESSICCNSLCFHHQDFINFLTWPTQPSLRKIPYGLPVSPSISFLWSSDPLMSLSVPFAFEHSHIRINFENIQNKCYRQSPHDYLRCIFKSSSKWFLWQRKQFTLIFPMLSELLLWLLIAVTFRWLLNAVTFHFSILLSLSCYPLLVMQSL